MFHKGKKDRLLKQSEKNVSESYVVNLDYAKVSHFIVTPD